MAPVASSQDGASTSSRVSWRAEPSASWLTWTPSSRTPGVGIDLLRAARWRPAPRRGRCRSADGSVTERVMVRKSWNRTLIVTVRPATPGRPQPLRHGVAEADELPLQRLEAVVVVGEGLLVADRLGPLVRDDVAVVDPHRQLPEVGAVGGAEGRRRRARSSRPARSATVSMPSRCSFSSVFGPTPHSACTGSGWRKASTSSGSTTFTPSPGSGPRAADAGLGRLRGQLGDELRRAPRPPSR